MPVIKHIKNYIAKHYTDKDYHINDDPDWGDGQPEHEEVKEPQHKISNPDQKKKAPKPMKQDSKKAKERKQLEQRIKELEKMIQDLEHHKQSEINAIFESVRKGDLTITDAQASLRG